MLQSILIGVDGSTHSSNALELGLRWAKRFDVMLVGLGVIDEPSICRSEMLPIGGGYYKQHADEVRMARARSQVDQFLERFALRCTEAGVAFKLLEDVGSPADRILLEAQRYDLIMLGQETYFQFATQDEPDETLTKVLKDAPRPVVTVPGNLGSGNNVLIAYDGSLQAARALQSFQASGLAGTDEVHILSIDTDHKEAARRGDRASEFLAFHNIKSSRHVVSPSPSISETIMNHAAIIDAGLVVMGCYGKPTLREFFLGSVTRTVLRKCSRPLFLYH